MAAKLSDDTQVAMPLRNILSINGVKGIFLGQDFGPVFGQDFGQTEQQQQKAGTETKNKKGRRARAVVAAEDGGCEGGGGCFPLHYDNAGPPSKRRLTCLVYLNPGWADGDGGELQLAPWLRPPVAFQRSPAGKVWFQKSRPPS